LGLKKEAMSIVFGFLACSFSNLEGGGDFLVGFAIELSSLLGDDSEEDLEGALK
jgi:hypothetical protein